MTTCKETALLILYCANHIWRNKSMVRVIAHNIWAWWGISTMMSVASGLSLSHLFWQCAGYLTSNFGVVMNESNIWEHNRLRASQLWHIALWHWLADEKPLSFQRTWCVLCLTMDPIFRRILAWRDFPSVSSLTIWRMNGVTSLPVIPLALSKCEKENVRFLQRYLVLMISGVSKHNWWHQTFCTSPRLMRPGWLPLSAGRLPRAPLVWAPLTGRRFGDPEIERLLNDAKKKKPRSTLITGITEKLYLVSIQRWPWCV